MCYIVILRTWARREALGRRDGLESAVRGGIDESERSGFGMQARPEVVPGAFRSRNSHPRIFSRFFANYFEWSMDG